jgi:hypothetical protein
VSVCYFVLSDHVVCAIVSGLSGCASGNPLVKISVQVLIDFMALRQVTDHVDVTCGVNLWRFMLCLVFRLPIVESIFSQPLLSQLQNVFRDWLRSNIVSVVYNLSSSHGRHVLRLTEGLLDCGETHGQWRCVVKDRPVNVAGKHRSSSDVHFWPHDGWEPFQPTSALNPLQIW